MLTKEDTLQKTYDIKHDYIKSKENNVLSMLHFFIFEKNTIKFKELYKNIDLSTDEVEPLLVMACDNNADGIAKFLIRKGIDVNKEDINTLNTPLHYALENKNFNLANLLISKGADEKKLNRLDQNPWQMYHFKLGLNKK